MQTVISLLNGTDVQGIDVSDDSVDKNYTPYQEAYAGKKDVYVEANGRKVDRLLALNTRLVKTSM